MIGHSIELLCLKNFFYLYIEIRILVLILVYCILLCEPGCKQVFKLSHVIHVKEFYTYILYTHRPRTLSSLFNINDIYQKTESSFFPAVCACLMSIVVAYKSHYLTKCNVQKIKLSVGLTLYKTNKFYKSNKMK